MEAIRKLIKTILEGQSKIVVIPDEKTKVFPDIDGAYARWNGTFWFIYDKFGWQLGEWHFYEEGKIYRHELADKHGHTLTQVGDTNQLEQAVRKLWLLNNQDVMRKKQDKLTSKK